MNFLPKLTPRIAEQAASNTNSRKWEIMSRERRSLLIAEMRQILNAAIGENRALTSAETEEYDKRELEVRSLDLQLSAEEPQVDRSTLLNPAAELIDTGTTYRRHENPEQRGGIWASQVAEKLGGGENSPEYRNLTTSGLDIPQLVEPFPIHKPYKADRLIDLLTDRKRIDGNEFSFIRQTLRDVNANVVADHAEKPVSLFNAELVDDRLRVIAHLSEPIPARTFDDHSNARQWLVAEMYNGLLDGLENQFVSGSGTGENMTGLLNVAGTTAVPFNTDIPTTIRKARTALSLLQEKPNALVLNPADMETLDLLREEADGAYLAALPGYSNVFGNIPRIESTSVPAGTAVLGDFTQTRIYTRHDMQMMLDPYSGFSRNEVTVRMEGRFGVAFLRPEAFAVVSLTV